jgi:isoleucyl-tRNA synthetase
MSVRAAVTRAAEPLRKAGTIGHSLDTHVTIYADTAILETLNGLGTDLRALFIVSGLDMRTLDEAPPGAFRDETLPGAAVTVERARGEKCARCWIYNENPGSNPNFPGLCPRCTTALDAGN